MTEEPEYCGAAAYQPRGQHRRCDDDRHHRRQADQHPHQQDAASQQGRQEGRPIDEKEEIARYMCQGGQSEHRRRGHQGGPHRGGRRVLPRSRVAARIASDRPVGETPAGNAAIARRWPQRPTIGPRRRRRTGPNGNPAETRGQSGRVTLLPGSISDDRSARGSTGRGRSGRRRRREQRTVAARTPHPLAVAHVPPCRAPGADLNHRPRLARTHPGPGDRQWFRSAPSG